jgi:hypothetical protein
MASGFATPHDLANDEDDNHKEVYAHFGLAAYWAQCVESSLNLFFLIYRRVDDATLTVQALDSMEAASQKQTLGHLLRDFRKYVDFSPDCEDILKRALEKRNFLMHCFFEARVDNFMSRNGRDQMIEELTAIKTDLQYADKVISVAYGCLHRELGVTEEMIQQDFEKRQAEAALSDQSASCRE